MNIEEVLNRYFEGETSAEEERELRRFFAGENVPAHLSAYRPLFAYFDEEIAAQYDPAEEIWQEVTRATPAVRRFAMSRRSVVYLLSTVAACVVALLGISQLLSPTDPCFCSDNYVVINGRCYTDIHKVRSSAFEALHEVATPAGDYFPEEDNDEADRRIIDDQLKELGSIFSEDE